MTWIACPSSMGTMATAISWFVIIAEQSSLLFRCPPALVIVHLLLRTEHR